MQIEGLSDRVRWAAADGDGEQSGFEFCRASFSSRFGGEREYDRCTRRVPFARRQTVAACRIEDASRGRSLGTRLRGFAITEIDHIVLLFHLFKISWFVFITNSHDSFCSIEIISVGYHFPIKRVCMRSILAKYYLILISFSLVFLNVSLLVLLIWKVLSIFIVDGFDIYLLFFCWITFSFK